MKFYTNLEGVKQDLEIMKQDDAIEWCEISVENSKEYEKVLKKCSRR